MFSKEHSYVYIFFIKPIKLSWKSLIAMEPLAISLLLCSTYDLPNATNLELWEYTNSDLCFSYKSDQGTLCHVLSVCPKTLQMYTWWHNKVLEVVIELLRAKCETANQQPVTNKEPIIQFHKEDEFSLRKQKNSSMKLLNGASDWKVSGDLKTSLQFPVHIIQTEKWPDIVVWSDSKKSVPLIELTVPWEENHEEAHKWKKNQYKTLCADCIKKGWIYHVIPIKNGCHGFLGRSVISFLSKIGITVHSLKVASYCLQTTVQYASSWIWLRAKNLQHEWNACGITIPVWLCNIKKQLLQVCNNINSWK